MPSPPLAPAPDTTTRRGPTPIHCANRLKPHKSQPHGISVFEVHKTTAGFQQRHRRAAGAAFRCGCSSASLQSSSLFGRTSFCVLRFFSTVCVAYNVHVHPPSKTPSFMRGQCSARACVCLKFDEVHNMRDTHARPCMVGCMEMNALEMAH